MSEQRSGPGADCDSFEDGSREPGSHEDTKQQSTRTENGEGAPDDELDAPETRTYEEKLAAARALEIHPNSNDQYLPSTEESIDPPEFKEALRILRHCKISFEDAKTLANDGLKLEDLSRDPRSLKNMANYVRKKDIPPPRWISISGLLPELRPHPDDRRKQIRALWKVAVLIMRRDLMVWEAEQTGADEELRAERSTHWDPVWSLSYRLELSQSKLSSFCRELTGSNLVQTGDNVKAEGLKRRMRGKIREFVAGLKGGSHKDTKGQRTQRVPLAATK